MFNINLRRLFNRTQVIAAEAYKGASKMGKGKKLKTTEVTADFQKFEDFFFQDAHVFGIITCIADSMAESGISFTHQDKDLMLQSNELAAEYELNTLISELTIANMVFGNSFPVIDPDNSEFDFLEQLSPKSLSINNENGRHAGWKFAEGETNAALTREQVLHIPINRLSGATWGTSPLQPLTRILTLKENIEVNLNALVSRYLVPRYVYLLGRPGTSVPQEIIDAFAQSLADPAVAQDQVFENNLEIQTMGTQYKALHVGYIIDYVLASLYAGLAFPDSFHIAKGSTESTAKIQMEIFNTKRIGGLQRVYTNPVRHILKAILEKEGVKFDTLPEPEWGRLSQTSLEAKVETIMKLAGITNPAGEMVLKIPELRSFLTKELGIALNDTAAETPEIKMSLEPARPRQLIAAVRQ